MILTLLNVTTDWSAQSPWPRPSCPPWQSSPSRWTGSGWSPCRTSHRSDILSIYFILWFSIAITKLQGKGNVFTDCCSDQAHGSDNVSPRHSRHLQSSVGSCICKVKAALPWCYNGTSADCGILFYWKLFNHQEKTIKYPLSKANQMDLADIKVCLEDWSDAEEDIIQKNQRMGYQLYNSNHPVQMSQFIV